MLQPFHARSLEVATSQGLQKDSILAVVKLQELQDLSQLGDLLEECYLAGTEGKTLRLQQTWSRDVWMIQLD